MAGTMPKQFRVLPETAQAIKVLQEQTGKGTADILRMWQSAFEKVGADNQSRDKIKSRINAVQEHFVAVIAELEAMAGDLQAIHESDSLKIKELEERNQALGKELERKGNELESLQAGIIEVIAQKDEVSSERDKLKEENENLKNNIMKKLAKL